jgi:dTDP-4-dehydrorhamnose 3,5-epimerase
MIAGVLVKPLRRIPDERGCIMHMIRSDDPDFERFGEIYFSTVYPGVVKGWHRHREMTLNYTVVHGTVKLVLYDDRTASPSHGDVQEIFLGDDNYCLVKIPPLIWNGFKGVGVTPAIVANCATLPHRADEIERVDPFMGGIPYDWSLKHR